MPHPILLQFIQKMQQLPPEKTEVIAGFFTEKNFSKNDLMIEEGKVCDEYFVLVEGLVRSQAFDLEGNDITTGFCSPQQIVADPYSFFKRIPCKENFYAITDCTVYKITYDEVQKAFHSMPEFREFGRGILINAYALLKQRMLSMLQETAEQRYSNLLHSNPDIIQNAPVKHIASYLGVTDTSLSRIRKEFSKK
jgi:CRP-like cAMP-binding protein